MSILSDAFDGVVDFFSGALTAVKDNTPISTGGQYGYGDLAGDIFSVAGPLIATSIVRPKALPLPERPTFPEIPDSIKNDPRMQQLLGGYGLGAPGQPNSFPEIQAQALPRQSDFALAFPAIAGALGGIAQREFSGVGTEQRDARAVQVSQQQSIDAAKGTVTPTSVAPAQVVDATVVQAEPTMLEQKVKYSNKNLGDAIKTTSQYDPLIQEASKKHGIDPDLLRAVIHTESSGDANAIGDGGKATGLGQLHLGAAQDAGGRPYTKEELKDPLTNIDLTAAYLRKLNNNFGGNSGDPDYSKAITAYNRGETAVKQNGAYNSPKGRQYRRKVMATLADVKNRSGGTNAA